MTQDDRKAIVFCDQAESVPLVVAALEASDVATASFTGAASRAKRDKAIAADWTVLVTTVAAGGVGLNLTQASRAVFFEPLLDIAAFRQAIGRVHRIGQKRWWRCTCWRSRGPTRHRPRPGHEAHDATDDESTSGPSSSSGKTLASAGSARNMLACYRHSRSRPERARRPAV